MTNHSKLLLSLHLLPLSTCRSSSSSAGFKTQVGITICIIPCILSKCEWIPSAWSWIGSRASCFLKFQCFLWFLFICRLYSTDYSNLWSRLEVRHAVAHAFALITIGHWRRHRIGILTLHHLLQFRYTFAVRQGIWCIFSKAQFAFACL